MPPPISYSVVRTGSPLSSIAAFAVVPPMSNEIMFGRSSQARQVGARDHARRGSGLDEVGGPAHRRRRAHRAARRLHDLERRRDAGGDELGRQGADVVAHGRAQVGIDDGRARPLVLADLRQDVRRAGDVDVVAEDFAYELGGFVLVLGIRIRVEQADRDRVDVVAADRLGGGVHRGRVEAAPDIASRPHRSAISRRRRRGTSGEGLSYWRSYITGILRRRISSTSRKPSVVISAVRAPRPSSTVFEATVVAWTTAVTSPGATPAASRRRGRRR